MIKPRLVEKNWQPTHVLERELERALLHNLQYLGEDPVLRRLHQVNIEWRQQELKLRHLYRHSRKEWKQNRDATHN